MGGALLKPVFMLIAKIWWIVALAVIAKIFVVWRNSPKQKGARGERNVSAKLRGKLPDEYRLMNDVYLPLPDGTTTQIDHIVISQYGIFVIETKTYSGWIYGDELSAQWMQIIYTTKNRFQNPLRQNYMHICALADNLGIHKSYFHNVVVFSERACFKTSMPENVVLSSQVVSFIRGFKKPIIMKSQVDEIAEAISEWQNSVGEELKANHVANLRKRHSVMSS